MESCRLPPDDIQTEGKDLCLYMAGKAGCRRRQHAVMVARQPQGCSTEDDAAMGTLGMV